MEPYLKKRNNREHDDELGSQALKSTFSIVHNLTYSLEQSNLIILLNKLHLFSYTDMENPDLYTFKSSNHIYYNQNKPQNNSFQQHIQNKQTKIHPLVYHTKYQSKKIK